MLLLLIEFLRPLKALANEDTLFEGLIVADTNISHLPARATFVADINIVSGTQKMFLILFRNILCPQQMFTSLRNMETQHSFCVTRVCLAKKHHEHKCVRSSVSSC